MFRSTVNEFAASRRGNIAIAFSLLAVPLILGAGMAVDYARLDHARTTAQSALDASLVGAIGKDGDLDQDLALQIYQDNLALLGGQTSTQPEYTKDADGNWTGRISTTTPLTFGNFVLPGEISFDVAAKAGGGGSAASPDIGCIYTLYNGSQSFLQNSGAKIDAPWCTIFVGTTVSNTQMTGFNSGFLLDVSKICVAGTLSYDNRQSSEKAAVEVETKCETPGDFIRDAAIDMAGKSSLTSVKNGSAVFSDWKSFDNNQVDKASAYSWLQNYTDGNNATQDAIEEVVAKNSRVVLLEPGRYQSINFNSGGYSIILKPGLYVIDGTWNINGQDMIGNNVSLFFTNNGKLQPNSGMGIKLTAPTSGDFKGMLWWEDPRVTSSQDWTINDNKADSYVKGVVYLPNRQVTLNSSAQSTYSAAFMVKKATINGGSKMTFETVPAEYMPDNAKFTPPTTAVASAGGGRVRLLQ